MTMPRKYSTKEEAQQARNLRNQRKREQETLALATALVQEVKLQFENSDESIAKSLLEKYRILRK